MSQLKEGQKAPAFVLPDEDENTVRLADYKGKTVVLYFYPKDDTPGCTTQACGFREGLNHYTSANAVILGVSPDSSAAHKKFKAKFALNFPLLSDVDKKVVAAYGVWKEKSMYGRTHMGVERTTFVIDAQGIIKKIFAKVKVAGHSEAILAALSESS